MRVLQFSLKRMFACAALIAVGIVVGALAFQQLTSFSASMSDSIAFSLWFLGGTLIGAVRYVHSTAP